MKDEVNAVKHLLHPSYFILPCTPSLTVGLLPAPFFSLLTLRDFKESSRRHRVIGGQRGGVFVVNRRRQMRKPLMPGRFCRRWGPGGRAFVCARVAAG